jgi:hypothetical protein
MEYLVKPEKALDWHFTPIQSHTQFHRLFPFYPADLQLLRHMALSLCPNSLALICQLSGGINKLVSADLLAPPTSSHASTQSQSYCMNIPAKKLLD